MLIETERLILRDFVMADWAAVLAYQSEARYQQFYPMTSRSEADAKAFVGMFVAQQEKRPRFKYQLAMTLKSSGQLIGNCGIRLPAPQAHQADLGYELAPEHWGAGYATEAARAMVAFGFETLGLHRIWAECLAENAGSVRVLQKLGMVQEGRLRHHQFFKNRYWDTLLFGLLRSEIS